ncbi:MAG TPA: DUF2934 domain-containing protein [Candidatus Sulfotelmatobacter sp.]|nr:DUF2934 domain-containing protein [Candidatus Sulfotelmatobacter sp.]
MMRSILKAEVTPKNHAELRDSTLLLEERIRKRAYELYEQRKRGDGHDVEDWLDAESELRENAELLTKATAA